MLNGERSKSNNVRTFVGVDRSEHSIDRKTINVYIVNYHERFNKLTEESFYSIKQITKTISDSSYQ